MFGHTFGQCHSGACIYFLLPLSLLLFLYSFHVLGFQVYIHPCTDHLCGVLGAPMPGATQRAHAIIWRDPRAHDQHSRRDTQTCLAQPRAINL